MLQGGLKRRSIAEPDLPAVADLLAAGFPARSREGWRRGLERMRTRAVPAASPRYGVMLETDGRPVGVLLMIFSSTEVAGRSILRCNLSSWHTEPAYVTHAPLLLSAALRAKEVTYLNISPAPRTQPIIEAQGFRKHTRGSLLTLPSLSVRAARARAVPLDQSRAQTLPEAGLIREHLAFGCLCFEVGLDGDAPQPFVFARPRRLRGNLPSAQLLFCRSLESYARCGGALGRALLRKGVPAILVDADDPVPGMPARRINAQQIKYVLGPHPPPAGDLAYTELAIFDD